MFSFSLSVCFAPSDVIGEVVMVDVVDVMHFLQGLRFTNFIDLVDISSGGKSVDNELHDLSV